MLHEFGHALGLAHPHDDGLRLGGHGRGDRQADGDRGAFDLNSTRSTRS